MDVGVTLLTNGLGVGFEVVILLVVALGGLVFFAKSVHLGLLFWFMAFGGVFMWFYQTSLNSSVTTLNYVLPLICMLITLVLISLSLFMTDKQAQIGGFV